MMGKNDPRGQKEGMENAPSVEGERQQMEMGVNETRAADLESSVALLKITPTTSFPRKRESTSSGTWTPACARVTRRVFISPGGPKAHGNSVETHA